MGGEVVLVAEAGVVVSFMINLHHHNKAFEFEISFRNQEIIFCI